MIYILGTDWLSGTQDLGVDGSTVVLSALTRCRMDTRFLFGDNLLHALIEL